MMKPAPELPEPRPTFAQRLIAGLRDAPPALLAYTAFAIAVTAFELGVMIGGFKGIREFYVPFTGWGASTSYRYTIFFAFALIYAPPHPKGKAGIRNGIAMFMLLAILFGVSRVHRIGQENFDNPYLTVSYYQPIWTMFIPGVWIALLYSPAMNQFCRKQQ
jgi:hypothetical protein